MQSTATRSIETRMTTSTLRTIIVLILGFLAVLSLSS
jgi:hypothetical protein